MKVKIYNENWSIKELSEKRMLKEKENYKSLDHLKELEILVSISKGLIRFILQPDLIHVLLVTSLVSMFLRVNAVKNGLNFLWIKVMR